MSTYVNRFGPREYRQAEDTARDTASDGTGIVHIVEVFDEETVFNAAEGVDMGPLYVVLDANLSEFMDDRDASVVDSMGVNPNELED